MSLEVYLELFQNYICLDSDESKNSATRLLCNYLSVSYICTDTIDSIFEEESELVLRKNKCIYYYTEKEINLFNYNSYITFLSREKEDPKTYQSVTYYVIVYSILTSNIVTSFLQKLFAINSHNQRLLKIKNNYGYRTKVYWETTQIGKALPNQQNILEKILNHWENNNFNSKIIVSGKSRTGKLNLGSLLKTYLENSHPKFKKATYVNLFNDIDLSLPFLDPISGIFSWSSEKTPVILTVRNIENYYQKSILGDQYSPNSHVYNKTSFNNLLDQIGSEKYVITIFTTQLTQDELEKISDKEGSLQSFSREGRSDLFINMSS